MPTCGNYGKCEEPRLLPGLAGCRDRAWRRGRRRSQRRSRPRGRRGPQPARLRRRL